MSDDITGPLASQFGAGTVVEAWFDDQMAEEWSSNQDDKATRKLFHEHTRDGREHYYATGSVEPFAAGLHAYHRATDTVPEHEFDAVDPDARPAVCTVCGHDFLVGSHAG